MKPTGCCVGFKTLALEGVSIEASSFEFIVTFFCSSKRIAPFPGCHRTDRIRARLMSFTPGETVGYWKIFGSCPELIFQPFFLLYNLPFPGNFLLQLLFTW